LHAMHTLLHSIQTVGGSIDQSENQESPISGVCGYYKLPHRHVGKHVDTFQ
jgi:hypothetical protein